MQAESTWHQFHPRVATRGRVKRKDLSPILVAVMKVKQRSECRADYMVERPAREGAGSMLAARMGVAQYASVQPSSPAADK